MSTLVQKKRRKKVGGAGGWATKTNRKLQDGDDDDCVAEMPPLERKKTAAPLRIELRDLHLAGEGVGGRVLCVWGLGMERK